MKTPKLNEQEQAVASYLKDIGVSYSVAFVGATKRDGWECDQWSPKFVRGGKALSESFYTGTGHRKSDKPMPADIARLRPNILARVEWEKRNLKPVAPCAASVLYNLIEDARGADQNFLDWCGDYGYDTDSRKAEKIYADCCDIRAKVNAFFNREEREQLASLLQDY